METINRMTTGYGRKCRECKSSPKFKTFCRGPSGTPFQQNRILDDEKFSLMMAVITAMVNPRMCSMHFGRAPPFMVSE